MARKRRALTFAAPSVHTSGAKNNGACIAGCAFVDEGVCTTGHGACKRARTVPATDHCATDTLALPDPDTDVVRFLSSPPSTPVAALWHTHLESPPARSLDLMARDGVAACAPEDYVCAVANASAGNAREGGRASRGNAPVIVVEHVRCPVAERGM